MSYFLTSTPLQLNTIHTIEGDEARHLLLSRRIKTGEEIELQDTKQERFICIVQKIGKKSLECVPVQKLVPPKEYTTHITLCQALIAEQALDVIIQKATELGAHAIVIFPSERSPHSLKPEKTDRWKKIAQEAAKQCGRTYPPQIILSTFTHLLDESTRHATFFTSQHAAQTLAELKQSSPTEKEIRILVGPEGGWSDTEQTQLLDSSAQGILLSRFILRAETAAITALGQISLYIS